jgi:hypothetical protein
MNIRASINCERKNVTPTENGEAFIVPFHFVGELLESPILKISINTDNNTSCMYSIENVTRVSTANILYRMLVTQEAVQHDLIVCRLLLKLLHS